MGQSGTWISADRVPGRQILRRGQRVDQEPDLTKICMGRSNASGGFTPVKVLWRAKTQAWMGDMLSKATVITDVDRRTPTGGSAIDRTKPAHLRWPSRASQSLDVRSLTHFISCVSAGRSRSWTSALSAEAKLQHLRDNYDIDQAEKERDSWCVLEDGLLEYM
jgi:hypothetical protein